LSTNLANDWVHAHVSPLGQSLSYAQACVVTEQVPPGVQFCGGGGAVPPLQT
jgi:hypothetical protein